MSKNGIWDFSLLLLLLNGKGTLKEMGLGEQ